MFISIIIPVYNAEKYLARCLDSIIASLKKSHQTAEIILVNNNSTDDSAKIIASYHKKYPKIVKSHPNPTPGASASRNFGVTFAKGDYIWFIDADDYISEDAISLIASTTKHRPRPDLIMFSTQKLDRTGHPTEIIPAISPQEQNYQGQFIRRGIGPWQVIIRRKWWLDHHFSFKEGIIHEDMELMSALILFTDRYTTIDEILYFYCDNPESVLHKSKFNPHIFDIFPALEGLHQHFTEQNAASQYYADLEWFFIWNLLFDSAADFHSFSEGRSGFKKSRQMLRQYFPHWRRNQYLRTRNPKTRLKIHLNYWGIKA